MSRNSSRRMQVALVAACVCGATLEGVAEEKSAGTPPAPVAGQPDAIAGAKKEFEAIKAARDAALRSKPDLPQVGMPEWQGTQSAPSAGATGMQAQNPARVTPKSTNWLVDAMQNQSSSRDSRGPLDNSERKRDREHGSELETNASFGSGAREHDSRQINGVVKDSVASRHANDASGHEERKNTANSVANPLTRYLGDWMTPQDYALLKPGISQSLGASPSEAKSPMAFSAPGLMSNGMPTTNPGFEATLGMSAATPAVFTPPPRENPFLQSLTLPDASSVSALSKPRVVPIVTPTVPTPTLAAPRQETANPPSKIPDFIPPSTDEKYFKQLKRF